MKFIGIALASVTAAITSIFALWFYNNTVIFDPEIVENNRKH